MPAPVQLEPEAQAFVEATSNPPFLFEMPPAEGRATVDKVQSSPVSRRAAKIEDITLGNTANAPHSVRILRPENSEGTLPVILYIHGAGWVFGNAHTHDKLVRELSAETGAAVVFPEYSLSPEAKYPQAVEECYATLKWISEQGQSHGLDASRLVVAGDSVGGNMTAATALLAKERGGPALAGQLMFYPVTDANFDTESYHQFATGYFLRRDAMQWFWDQYTTDPAERQQITASPLRATEEQLRGLPPALVITAEADVLRDEGEAYARQLRAAGVRVTAARFEGIVHDFVMLNTLDTTAATRGAMALATTWLRQILGTA